MKLSEWALQICTSGNLEDKLYYSEQIEFDDFKVRRINTPSRNKEIAFSNNKIKFPKNLSIDRSKAIAFHFFANHELLAIEMMAAALLLFKHDSEDLIRLKKGIIQTIKDEQVHFKLYQERIRDFGFKFGDFPVNDFFWKQMKSIQTPEEYLSVVAITFEGANLDFAHYYWQIFKEMGDDKSAQIMKKVFEDEISHVALGRMFLDHWRDNKDLWTYYLENLPWPMTPARAKGSHFIKEARIKAGLDTNFVDKLEEYTDEFKITQRKSWK